jgi:hypothetical protein
MVMKQTPLRGYFARLQSAGKAALAYGYEENAPAGLFFLLAVLPLRNS